MSNFQNVRYSSDLFFGAIFVGTLISISGSNWMVVWTGLELNMMSFLGWMCTCSSRSLSSMSNWGRWHSTSFYPANVEPFAKYFLAQSVGTAFFLFSPLLWGSPNLVAFSPFFLLFGMMLKSGVAPFHQWFPSVCANVPWSVNVMLAFWQKIAPLYIMTTACLLNSGFFFIVALINLFFGAVGGLGQTQLRPLLAYSSISHMGWMMGLMGLSKIGFFYYFLLYGLMVVPTLIVFCKMSVYSFKQMETLSASYFSVVMLSCLFVLSVAGIPPFSGFFMKVYSVYLMVLSGNYMLSLFFVFFAAVSLSYYIHIVFFSSLYHLLGRPYSTVFGFYSLLAKPKFFGFGVNFLMGFSLVVCLGLPFIGALSL